ncbi:Hsp20 family protein [Halobaculum sp. CBA1158]|uniref:Hsp20/alpha crystallin family protein n=1 Tax=Halobaculum sp. CBA1158 TaxID=2904243 RepID=UPI001F2AA0CF|nr:Hsp20 family protein [Halobaculum sp. CBA1158]UIP00917.1 Hsp20 family protein [Halobaculum sp. CBA1158]
MSERDPPADGAKRLKDVGESAMNTVLDRVGRGVATVQEKSPLAYDLLESEDAFLVVFDAPGAQRSDVQVRFNDGAVEVRIDRFRDFREGFEMRFPGRGLALDGRAELPPGASVDPAGASSTLTERGTLRVRLPKTEGGSVAVADAADEASDDDSADGDDAADDPVELDLGDDGAEGDAAGDDADTTDDAEDADEADDEE